MRKSSLKIAVCANYIGQGYVAFIVIAFVPYIVKRLGPEGYGLVGFFTMLQGWMLLLDVGLSNTVTREAARSTIDISSRALFSKILKTVMLWFGSIAIAIAISVFLLAPYIVKYWLKSEGIPFNELSNAIKIIGVAIACRFLLGPLRGILIGQNKQVLANALNMFFSTLKFIIVIPVLDTFGSTVTIYFKHQLFSMLLELILYIILTIKSFVISEKYLPLEASKCINNVWKFALSIAFTNGAWIIFTQLDKVILSKYLSLKEFGYYSLAIVAANGLNLINGPISQAILPRMSRLFIEGKIEDLFETYHKATQIVAIIIAPSSIVLAFNAEHILYLWTGDFLISQNASNILFWYALGNGILAMVAFPYYLQYAHGNLKLHVQGNIIYLFVVIPALVVACIRWGAVGAGIVWLTFNTMYLIGFTWIVHRKFMNSGHCRWLIEDVGIVFLCVLIENIIFSIIFTQNDNKINMFLSVTSTFILSLSTSVCASSMSRNKIIKFIRGK